MPGRVVLFLHYSFQFSGFVIFTTTISASLYSNLKFKTVKYDRWANQNIWKCYDDVGMSLQKFDDGGHTLVQVSSVMKRVVVWWAKYSRAKGGKTNHRLRWFLLVCLMRIIAFKPSMKKINYSFEKVNKQLIMITTISKFEL